MVIREVIKASGAALEGGSDRRVYTERENSFYSLAGSGSRARMMRILLDHKFEIGYRTTGKIVIIPDGIGL